MLTSLNKRQNIIGNSNIDLSEYNDETHIWRKMYKRTLISPLKCNSVKNIQSFAYAVLIWSRTVCIQSKNCNTNKF